MLSQPRAPGIGVVCKEWQQCAITYGLQTTTELLIDSHSTRPGFLRESSDTRTNMLHPCAALQIVISLMAGILWHTAAACALPFEAENAACCTPVAALT